VDEEELTKDWNLTLHDAVCSTFDKFHDADKDIFYNKNSKKLATEKQKNT